MNTEKVREALRCFLENINTVRGDIDAGAFNNARFVIKGCREALATLEDDGWVRCSERLPESNRPVLAYFVNSHGKGRRIRAQYAAPNTLELGDDQEFWDGCTFSDDGDTVYCEPGWYETNEYEETHYHVTDEVTHWRNLPSPPDETKSA